MTHHRRTLLVTCDDKPLRWPNHAPGAQLDYTLDLTAEMKADADAVASVAVTGGGDLVLAATATTPTTATLWISGGDPGTDHVFAVAVSTTGGRTFVYAVALYCGAGVLTSAPLWQLIGPQGPSFAGSLPSTIMVLTMALLAYPPADPGDGTPYWNGGVLMKGTGAPGIVSALTALLLSYPNADPGTGAPYWDGGAFVKGTPT